jgi:glycosyltransferase involved in cell wall biosynthesis
MAKITVITINYNMREGLLRTIRSVLAQRYMDLEYIVVDGNSTDGSRAVLESELPPSVRWSSEPDSGIYDAMNKGVRLSSGDWVIFLNSGDIFADSDVIQDVFAAPRTADLIYGDKLWRYPQLNLTRFVSAEDPGVLPYRMHCSHQALFTRRTVLASRPFRTDINAADYAFLLTAWVEGMKFEHVNRTICVAESGGVSDRNRLDSLRQRMMVVRAAGLLSPAVRLGYARMAILALAGNWLRAVLPASLVRKLLTLKGGSV